jgi:endo-1,4-beta-xylanase
VAAREIGYATAESEMKFDATEPRRGHFDFSLGDQVVKFAKDHGMRVKGHTLVWYQAHPDWLDTLTAVDDIRAAMLDHIKAVVTHYKGQVIAWDVVNEALEDGAPYRLRNDLWHKLGDTYIEEAFRATHAADPDALLFYNDYGAEGLGGKADAVYALVQRLKNTGVPIHGVGLQMHVGVNRGPSADEVAKNMARLAALGLIVNISELDVTTCGAPGDEATQLAAQARRYHDLVATCVGQPKCNGVTVWGITDNHSWLNVYFACPPNVPRGLLWAADGAAKPAVAAVRDALLGR